MFGTSQRQETPRFPGLYIGQVMDLANYVTLGQIKVSIPSIFDPPTPDNWVSAKLCFLFGHFLLPAVGENVWLAFENGDPRSPVCLGVLYPPQQTPAEVSPVPITSGLVKTTAGHLINLNGLDGSVEIQAVTGAKIQLTATAIVIDAGSAPASVQVMSTTEITLNSPKVNLSSSAALPVARLTDQGIGNLGAPVVIASPGNPNVLA